MDLVSKPDHLNNHFIPPQCPHLQSVNHYLNSLLNSFTYNLKDNEYKIHLFQDDFGKFPVRIDVV